MAKATPLAKDIELAEAAGTVLFGDRPPGVRAEPPVSNGRLALLLFIATETMLFTAFMGAFVLFRSASMTWPPPEQPYLPIAVTFVNTLILLSSAVFMRFAVQSARQRRGADLLRWLTVTAVLGTVFLLVQGLEWVRLIHHGLTLSSSVYASTFYVLIGLHAAHVVGAVLWLLGVLVVALRGRLSTEDHAAVELCGMYWYFVCGVWPVLFLTVYF